jgi:hypothetical protein
MSGFVQADTRFRTLLAKDHPPPEPKPRVDERWDAPRRPSIGSRSSAVRKDSPSPRPRRHEVPDFIRGENRLRRPIVQRSHDSLSAGIDETYVIYSDPVLISNPRINLGQSAPHVIETLEAITHGVIGGQFTPAVVAQG